MKGSLVIRPPKAMAALNKCSGVLNNVCFKQLFIMDAPQMGFNLKR